MQDLLDDARRCGVMTREAQTMAREAMEKYRQLLVDRINERAVQRLELQQAKNGRDLQTGIALVVGIFLGWLLASAMR